jgi:hypothetical protein
MGQYFAAVNTDKKEFVCPWCIGGVAKLWEWAANPWGAIFCLLLRKSDGTGGGDFDSGTTIDLDLAEDPKTLARAVAAGIAREGLPVRDERDPIASRWAGDRVVLLGDYDSSKLWKELYENKTYRNISRRLVEVWNDFIEIDRLKLKYTRCSTCREGG